MSNDKSREAPFKSTTREHPSYGVVAIARTQMTPTTLFGSSIKHQHGIILEVKRAVVERALSEDWIHGRETIVEVILTPSQFADMITSTGLGDGTPCTLRAVNGKLIESDEIPSKRAEFKQEFDQAMTDVAKESKQALQEADNLLQRDRITKGDVRRLRDSLYKIEQELRSNLGFITDQFQRQIEKSVVEAKANVEAFVETVARQTGLNALKSSAQLHLSGEKESDKK